MGLGIVRPVSRLRIAFVVAAVTIFSGWAGAGCADRRAPAAAQTPREATSDPASTRASDPAAGAAVDPPEAGAPSPSPSEPPAPPVATLPDGTAIVACADPPPAGMACVPGGPFVRGSDDGPEHSRPAATIHLQTFYMDLDEVTYAQYGACMKERGCPRARPRYLDFDHPNIPMTGVSWFDAKAYCEKMGKHLPTEAQWEKAARGPDGKLYPWGDEPVTCERAIIQDATGRSCGVKKEKSKPETGRPWDVGSRPAGVYGLRDMVGNSWEWVADWSSRSWADCGEACTGIDPKGPCAAAETCAGHSRKVVRGGSWYWPAEMATGIYRRNHVPSNDPFHHFGFRCAASIEEAAAMQAAK